MDPAVLPASLGEFRIEAILGEGGSGVVYAATWGPRRVALKVLHPSLTGSQRVRAQFLSEAQKLQGIAHPAVVKVLSFGEFADGRPYLAMEHLEGETLASVLARGALPLPKALELFAELCGAVGALHEQGLIHRDLKPENVFVVAGKHAVLLDFGIAKELDAPASTTTMDGGVRGTPAYMAPERFFGQAAGLATDIYELAVTLYAMLAGRLPWDDLADPEVRLQARPLVELAQVPADLDVEIRRALSTRAQNRPASALGFLDAVRVAAGSSESPTAPSDTARMRPAAEAPKQTVTAERTPWFAGRQSTTDRGKTPLAWAPTQQAEPVPVPRRRWPWLVGVLTIVTVTASAVWWRFHGGEPPAVPITETRAVTTPVTPVTPTLPPDKDPWGAPRGAEPPPAPIPISGAEVSVAVARAELARALPHLPIDTTVIAGAIVGQLRRDDRFDAMFDKLAKSPPIALFLSTVPPCVRTLISRSEWFVFGAASLAEQQHGTLMIRGRWKRGDVERCFASATEAREMNDGTRMLQLPELGWLDFVDEHTAYISVRQDLAAAQVHDNVVTGRGMTPRARALVATVPADSTLLFVVDGRKTAAWPTDAIPPGTDMATWLRTEEDGVALDVGMAMTDDAAAKRVEAKVRPQLDGLFGPSNASVGKLEVVRQHSSLHVRGRLSSLMIGIVSSAIP